MARRAAATHRVPMGANPLTYRPGIKKERQARAVSAAAAWAALPAEEKARRIRESQEYEEDMRQWRLDFSQFGPDRAKELLGQRRAQRRALTKLVDREARIAVEGDTDTNHDNLEDPK
jgi:hypothetical protein